MPAAYSRIAGCREIIVADGCVTAPGAKYRMFRPLRER